MNAAAAARRRDVSAGDVDYGTHGHGYSVQRRADFHIERAIAAGPGGDIDVVRVPIASDCTDGIQEAFYARPEALLDPAVRRARSAWTFVPDAVVERFVERLSKDLGDGTWDRAYGALRAQPSCDGMRRLVVGRPACTAT